MRTEVLGFLEQYKAKGFAIQLKDKGVRNHIDIIPPNFDKLNFRIDLLDTLPYMQQFHHATNMIEVNSDYYDIILQRKRIEIFNYPLMYEREKTFTVNFPSHIDDLVLRFMEWVWQPHKTRHIKYVIKHLTNDFTDEFIATVNKYTNIEIDQSYVNNIMSQKYE